MIKSYTKEEIEDYILKFKRGKFSVDSETTGFNEYEDKIITIQFQKVDNFGRAIDDLIILKEWEFGEEQIIKWFFTLINNRQNKMDIVLLMQNHHFDFRFLITKFKQYGLIDKNISDLSFLYKFVPIIDINSILILNNNFYFKGAGLTNMTEKKGNASDIPIWYENKQYDLIEEYIIQEMQSFNKAFGKIYNHIQTLKILDK